MRIDKPDDPAFEERDLTEADVADETEDAPEISGIGELEGKLDPTADIPATGEDEEHGLIFPGPGA